MVYETPLSCLESVEALAIFTNDQVLVKTCQMYLFTAMKHQVYCQYMV